MTLYKCYTCKKELLEEAFYKGSHACRPVAGKCKECMTAYRKARQEANPEKVRQEQQAARERDKQNNPGKQYARVRNWKTANPERNREQNNRVRSRRDALIRGANQVEPIGLADVYTRDKGICLLCNLPCSCAEASIDHKKALSNGGQHTWDNVQLAHRTCNSRKGAK